MAKSSQALLVSALCFFGLLGFAYCHDFVVEGDVYCDTCRVMFRTRVSEPIVGAKVLVQCRSRENGTIDYTAEGVTDSIGKYQITVDGEHEEDICEVTCPESTLPDCTKMIPGRDHARIVLTHNNGIVSNKRMANSLGFLKKETLDVCPEVLKEMGLLPTVNLGP